MWYFNIWRLLSIQYQLANTWNALYPEGTKARDHRLVTARNEVGARLYFHRRLWFCPQGGGGAWSWGGVPGGDLPPGRILLWAIRILLECILVQIILEIKVWQNFELMLIDITLYSGKYSQSFVFWTNRVQPVNEKAMKDDMCHFFIHPLDLFYCKDSIICFNNILVRYIISLWTFRV